VTAVEPSAAMAAVGRLRTAHPTRCVLDTFCEIGYIGPHDSDPALSLPAFPLTLVAASGRSSREPGGFEATGRSTTAT
jgi:hypothetical protein